MKSTPTVKITIIAIVLAAAATVSACSPSAERLNQDGNEAFSRQAYDEAQFAYQSALEESPELAEPYYNLANTLYRKGGFDQAVGQIQQAISLTSEEALAQNSLYNLGNNTFSLQDWGASVEAYKQALLLNPDDQDAKYNLELALKQIQQQEQEQNQGDQAADQQSQGREAEENQDQGQQGDQNQDQQEQENPQDSQGQEAEQNQDDQNAEGEGSPTDGSEENQAWESPQPGERMTAEQARQLLAALLQNSQTLQEKLGQILSVRGLPPLQDW